MNVQIMIYDLKMIPRQVQRLALQRNVVCFIIFLSINFRLKTSFSSATFTPGPPVTRTKDPTA